MTPLPQTPGGDRFGIKPTFCGSGLTLQALGSKSTTQKFLARSKVGPENFGTFCRDTLTHGLTDTKK